MTGAGELLKALLILGKEERFGRERGKLLVGPYDVFNWLVMLSHEQKTRRYPDP